MKIKIAEKEKLLALYEGGATLQHLDKVVEDASITTIWKVLTDEGATMRPSGRRRKGVDSTEIIRLYVDEGMSLKQVGEQVGCSPSAVKLRLTEEGVECRRAGVRKTPEMAARAKLASELNDSGLDYATIGERIGASGGRAWQMAQAWRRGYYDGVT